VYAPQCILDPPTNADHLNTVVCRDDRSFIYAPPAPVLLSGTSLIIEKEWGEPPSPDEIFSIADLDEFVGTDFSCLRISVLPNRFPGVHAASQYDPYAEVHLSGVQPMPRIPPALLGHVPLEELSVGPSVIPGFAPGISPTSPGAGIYGEPHPNPPTSSRFERDHLTSSSSDADLYGSPPHNLSPHRGSDHLESPQVTAHHDLQSIRKFDTSILLYVIPEVRPRFTIYVHQLRPDDRLASFSSRTFCRPFRRSPIAHSTF